MQVLKRKIKIENETEDDYAFQASINSNGRIVLRFYKPGDEKNDMLVCLTRAETLDLINFIKGL